MSDLTAERQDGLGAVTGMKGEAGHSCNDLTVSSRGEVLLSDSESSRIYALAPGADSLGVRLEAGHLRSPQGLAFSPDETHLFVADYADGISRIQMTTGEITPLAHQADLPLLGIDGLYAHGADSLIAVQNGVSPPRVVRLNLSLARDRVVGSKILEMNNPIFGTIFPMNRLAEPVILKLDLE